MANYYNKDLYKALDVTYEATLDEIKSSYRKLVRLYHPDVAGTEEAIEKFKEIKEAYDVLSNEQSRKKYDVLHGFYKEKIKKDFEASKTKKENKNDEYIKKAKKRTKSSEPFAKSLNEAIDTLFKTTAIPKDKTKTKQKKESKQIFNGDDINMNLTINCFEAANGTSRKVNILHTRPCPNCNGRKFINGSVCAMCKGSGIISDQKKINVKIPKGVSKGTKVRVKGEGNPGINGGKNGDLYLIIDISENSHYEIDGTDVLCTLPITPPEAIFGADITIPSMDGKVTVKIPPMTSSGQKLRLAGEGLANKSNTKKGDMIITVMIMLPQKLSEDELDLYEELSHLSTNEIRKDLKNAKQS